MGLELWDQTVVVQASDFARTLEPNSGDGTDHAWGGNYLLFGGPVKGGEIYGTYLERMNIDGPHFLRRGRIIPTTPWDSVFNSIAMWLGVPEEDLDNVCPNRDEFPSLFSGSDLFTGVTEPSPTTSPLPTSDPTNKPSPVPGSTAIPLTWELGATYNDMDVTVGDTVTFTWISDHNVYRHPSGTCDRTDSTLIGATSPTSYTFTDDDVGKSVTFACQQPFHCEVGQKITFKVKADGPT